jgi:hypothetical protein
MMVQDEEAMKAIDQIEQDSTQSSEDSRAAQEDDTTNAPEPSKKPTESAGISEVPVLPELLINFPKASNHQSKYRGKHPGSPAKSTKQ